MASKQAGKAPAPKKAPAKTPAAAGKRAGVAASVAPSKAKAKPPFQTEPSKAPAAKPKAAVKRTKPVAPAMKKPPGRQGIYTPELAEAICERIASGDSLRTIEKLDGMPTMRCIMKWLAADQPEFVQQYARAREAQADKLAEEILAIADDGSNDTYEDKDGNQRTDTDVIARSKLRVEARKWLASKMAPKKYGDKLAVGGDDEMGAINVKGHNLTDAERAVRLTHAMSSNPSVMAALAAAIGKKVGK